MDRTERRREERGGKEGQEAGRGSAVPVYLVG